MRYTVPLTSRERLRAIFYCSTLLTLPHAIVTVQLYTCKPEVIPHNLGTVVATVDMDRDQLCHSRMWICTISYHIAYSTLTCHLVSSLTPTNERNNVNVSFVSHDYVE